MIYIGSTAPYITSSLQFNSAPHKGTLMHNFLGTNLFKPMSVFVDCSSKLHCLVRKHFGEQFAVYGRGSEHQFCDHAKVFNNKQKQKQQRERKTYWARQYFFAATQALLPIGAPTKGYQFGFHVQIFSILAPLCKYVLAQGAVVARFGRNFTTSLFGFCSSWVQVLARNSNKYIGISKLHGQNLTTSLFGFCSSWVQVFIRN